MIHPCNPDGSFDVVHRPPCQCLMTGLLVPSADVRLPPAQATPRPSATTVSRPPPDTLPTDNRRHPRTAARSGSRRGAPYAEGDADASVTATSVAAAATAPASRATVGGRVPSLIVIASPPQYRRERTGRRANRSASEWQAQHN